MWSLSLIFFREFKKNRIFLNGRVWIITGMAIPKLPYPELGKTINLEPNSAVNSLFFAWSALRKFVKDFRKVIKIVAEVHDDFVFFKDCESSCFFIGCTIHHHKVDIICKRKSQIFLRFLRVPPIFLSSDWWYKNFYTFGGGVVKKSTEPKPNSFCLCVHSIHDLLSNSFLQEPA